MAGHTELNEDEKEALKGLSYLQRCVYVFGIRWFMDSKTKIAGIKRGISYQSIAEELYVEPVPGIQDTGTPSRMQIRRAVSSLEKAGLIVNKSTGKKLILECVLARQSNYVQNKADTRPTQQADTQADTGKNMQNTYKNSSFTSASIPQEDTQADIAKIPQADTPPLSNIHNITLPNAQDFFNLLARQGYYINQLQNNKSTRAMIHQWVQARITLEEAQIGINHANAQKPPKPDSPTYYLKPVLQVRSTFERAQQQANEVKHDRRQAQQSTHTNQQRYPKSATKQFWERQEEIMRGFNDDKD